MALQKLNRRHKEFIAHYIQTKNATESAKNAGYKDSNAYDTGYKLLQEPIIKAKISELFRARDIDSNRILAEYVELLESPDSSVNDKRGVLDSLSKIKGLMRDNTTNINVGDSIVDDVRSSIDGKYRKPQPVEDAI